MICQPRYICYVSSSLLHLLCFQPQATASKKSRPTTDRNVSHGTLRGGMVDEFSLSVYPVLVKFATSLLVNRVHRVKLGGYFSHFAPVLIGVPESSVLGPVLFVFLINSLSEIPLSRYSNVFCLPMTASY